MAKARRWEDKWMGVESHERSEWVMLGPSRTLRKLYLSLEVKDAEIELAREAKYCLDHAPTDYRMRRAVLNKLFLEREEIVRRINLKQNNGEG